MAQTHSQAADQQDMLDVARTRALEKLQKDGVQAAIDSETWIKIGLAMVELFLECRKNKQSPEAMAAAIRRPTLFQKIRLRRALVKHVGRKELRQLKSEGTLGDALVEVGNGATDAEARAFVAQVLQG